MTKRKTIAKFKTMFGVEELEKILPKGYALEHDPDFDDRFTIVKIMEDEE